MAEEKTEDTRVYYRLLERVGSSGTYQTNVFIIFTIIVILGTSTFFINTYLFYQQPYNCGNYTGNCDQMVCSLPPEQRAKYLPPQIITTLGNYNGDNHCQTMKNVTAMEQAILLGASIGLFLGVIITDAIGRRSTMLVSMLITIIGILLVLIFANIKVKCAGLVLWGSGTEISFTILYSYITEIVDQKQRSNYYIKLYIDFAIGTTANAVIFYLLKDWILVLSLYYVLFYTIALIAFYLYVENPPIQIISKSTDPKEAYDAFMRMAAKNNNENHGITLQEIQSIHKQYHDNQNLRDHKYFFTFVDIFRYGSLRSDFGRLGLTFFLLMFLLYAPPLLLDKLFTDIFLNGIVNGVSQFATIPVLIMINATLSRTKGLMIMFAGTAIFTFIQFAINSTDCIQCNSNAETIIITILFFIARFFINLCSNFFANTISQTFPAQIRAICVCSVVGVGRFSTLIIPFLPKLKQSLSLSYNLIFGIAGVLGILASALIRETINIPPPEMIKQLEFQTAKDGPLGERKKNDIQL